MNLPSGLAKAKRSKWRFPFAIILLGLIGYGGVRGSGAAAARYRHWKSARAVAHARAFYAAHDLANAQIALRVAFEAEPSRDAYVLWAEMLEAANSSQAITARRVASQSAPRDPGLRLALARTALHFNDDATVEEVLAGCSEHDQGTSEYKMLAISWALHRADWASAERLLTEVESQDAPSPSLRILRASISLHNRRREIAEAARQELQHLVHDPSTRLAALRALAQDASSRKDVLAAADIGDQWAAAPDASFDDLLQAASAQEYGRPNTGADPALLQRIAHLAEKDEIAAALYVHWLMVHGQSAQALTWLEGLPPPLAKSPAIDGLKANVLVAREDWAHLRPYLSGPQWGSLPAPSIEFAYLSRLARTQGNRTLAESAWKRAMAEASGSEMQIVGLSRLAAVWSWPETERQTLLTAVEQYPKDNRIYLRLTELLRAQRDTSSLCSVCLKWHQAFPSIEQLGSDWAMLSLLLHPPAAANAATSLLAQLHGQDADNAYFTTNYAFALFSLGQVREACALIDALRPVERTVRSRAPIIASIYAAAGRADDARKFLDMVPPARALLPEEIQMLNRARQLAGYGR